MKCEASECTFEELGERPEGVGRVSVPRLGAHESISGGLASCVDRGVAAGCEVLQIFTKSNHQWAGKDYSTEEMALLFQRLDEAQLPVVASHSSYLINIASPDQTLWRKSVDALEDEVRRCDLLRIPNLVFHPGAHTGSGEESGIERIAAGLNQVLRRRPDSPTTLCLEATAGQGSNLGQRIQSPLCYHYTTGHKASLVSTQFVQPKYMLSLADLLCSPGVPGGMQV